MKTVKKENQKLIDEINDRYYSGDYIKYKILIDDFIEKNKGEPDSYGVIYLRSMAFEDGTFGEVDLQSAEDGLNVLFKEGFIAAQLNNSMARVLYKKNPLNIVKSTKLVQEALEIEDNTDSMIYMGYLCAKKGDHKKAFSWYKKAANHKDPWGYVFMSEALAKEGKSFASFWLRLKAFFIDKNTLRDYQDVYPFFE